MAFSISQHSGIIIALEGPADVVSTQLRLIAQSPRVLLLPPVTHYLPHNVNYQTPFSLEKFIHSVCEAVRTRNQEAADFVCKSTQDQSRLVIANGGHLGLRAFCISQIAQHITYGSIKDATRLFSILIRHGLSAAMYNAETLQTREDTMTRAMKAAEELDFWTSNLQCLDFSSDGSQFPASRDLHLPVCRYTDESGDSFNFYVFGDLESIPDLMDPLTPLLSRLDAQEKRHPEETRNPTGDRAFRHRSWPLHPEPRPSSFQFSAPAHSLSQIRSMERPCMSSVTAPELLRSKKSLQPCQPIGKDSSRNFNPESPPQPYEVSSPSMTFRDIISNRDGSLDMSELLSSKEDLVVYLRGSTPNPFLESLMPHFIDSLCHEQEPLFIPNRKILAAPSVMHGNLRDSTTIAIGLPTPANTPPPPPAAFLQTAAASRPAITILEAGRNASPLHVQKKLRAVLEAHCIEKGLNQTLLSPLPNAHSLSLHNSTSPFTKPQIFAIGATEGVSRELHASIFRKFEHWGPTYGSTKSVSLDLRYLIANAMQSFTSQPLAHQAHDNPFTSPYALATLLLLQLEVHLDEYPDNRFLVVGYPPDHLDTVLALQRLAGDGALIVIHLSGGKHPDSRFVHMEPKPAFSHSESGLRTPANFLLTSSISKSDIDAFMDTIAGLLPTPPQDSMQNNDFPIHWLRKHQHSPASPPLSDDMSFVEVRTGIAETIELPKPVRGILTAVKWHRPRKHKTPEHSFANPNIRNLQESVKEIADDDDDDLEERRLVPWTFKKKKKSHNTQKAFKMLGLV